jgi:adenylate kinase
MTGLSGVGKSTLLRKLLARVNFQHVQASALIKMGRQLVGDIVSSVDQLRDADLDANQRVLIHAFWRTVDPAFNLIILDGHSVIERDDGLTLISPDVFGAIGIKSMIFLADDPVAIEYRRASDAKRSRLVKSVENLQSTQNAALSHAGEICHTLGVPLHVFSPAQYDAIGGLLLSYRFEGSH